MKWKKPRLTPPNRKKVWDTIHSIKLTGERDAEVVLVLPHNYGWGMRYPNDRLWGIWAPDERASLIWNVSRKLLNQYNFGLDMVYEDARFPVDGLYANIYYWNQTT
jgi:hypothetical protein